MLKEPCAAMLWRRVAHPQTINHYAAEIMGWPQVGGDVPGILSCVYDGGNVMLGFGCQAEEMTPEVCSQENLRRVEAAINPASEFEVVPSDFDGVVQNVCRVFDLQWEKVAGSILRNREGRRLSFFDSTGNLTTLAQPNEKALAGPIGQKLGALLARRGLAPSSNGHPDYPATLVGVAHVVSNLQRSLRFYRDILGLEPLRLTTREARFDIGPLILTVRQELEVGLMAAVRRQNAFRDSLIFLVEDLASEVRSLKTRGVDFPAGIECSSTANQMAYCFDPDGHKLILWQSPDGPAPDMPVDYFPVLERILAEEGVSKSLSHSEVVR
jgi:catechol 2,3-dioxygenase-like lactoylglutathione lyase family enzyme